MDFGIAGRNAIVCASSSGLGFACALALAAEGVNVVINGRDKARLQEAAARLGTTAAGTVDAVQADINTREGRKALLAACPSPDILVNNNAGPTPVALLAAEHQDWITALDPIC